MLGIFKKRSILNPPILVVKLMLSLCSLSLSLFLFFFSYTSSVYIIYYTWIRTFWLFFFFSRLLFLGHVSLSLRIWNIYLLAKKKVTQTGRWTVLLSLSMSESRSYSLLYYSSLVFVTFLLNFTSKSHNFLSECILLCATSQHSREIYESISCHL